MWSGYRRAAWPELYSARPGIVAIGKAYEAEANWCVRAEFVDALGAAVVPPSC